MHDVARPPGLEIIDTDDIMAILNKALAQMPSNKPSSPRYNNPAKILTCPSAHQERRERY
ncbi:hypothetical protein [Tritonibacter sp. SIMBA_163]|uniref:hypothetical protein n=1 Tax=Tritonibacter sp. SIMBA_163 TaxID=3080868 RepID=UPI0039816EF2